MAENKDITGYASYRREADAIEQTRRFRHDIKNHLASLKALIDSGNYERASEYAGILLGRLDKISEDAKTYSDSVIADAVFSSLATKCADDGVDFEASCIFDGLKISDVELCTVLSNLADNAYEAVLKAPVGKRFIRFSVSRREKWFIILEENSFDGTIVRSDGDFHSTKADPDLHGYGLKNIKAVAESHGGKVEVEIDEKEQMFYISVIFPRNKV